MRHPARLIQPYFHYAWVVAAVIFLTVLAGASTRAAPGVMMVPLEQAFGWTRIETSQAFSLSLLLFGLAGPFGAAVMQRFGLRRTVLTAMTAVVIAVALSLLMTSSWQLTATWGLLVGLSTGTISTVMGAIIANRWFVANRGLVLGFFSAGIAAGQLIFFPALAAIAEAGGWQPVVWAVTITTAAVIPLIWWLLPEGPSDVGLGPYGSDRADDEPIRRAGGNPLATAFTVLWRAAQTRAFWILAGSFLICGLSTNGLVGTHLIAACFDMGVQPVAAAGLLAMMGVFNMVGAMAAGWASDRWDSRWLLFWFYATRGVSLVFLPYSDFSLLHLSVFAAFYGLDWIATGPPTMKLITENFGKQNAPILWGWIFAIHQIGSAAAAYGAGVMRESLNSYIEAFIVAGIACFFAAMMILFVGRRSRDAGLRPVAAEG